MNPAPDRGRVEDPRAPAGLRRVQEVFWALITAPQGVRPGIEALARAGRTSAAEVEAIFAGDDRLPAADRLDIYANMYFFRLLDCLGEDYPKARALLGHDRFHNLATDYVLACPSGHPSLRHFGSRLPVFLETHPLRAGYPYLADLARLEWARGEVFDAPDARPLSRDDLARLPADRAGEAVFSLVPACSVIAVDHAVAGVWRDLDRQAGAAPGHEPVPISVPVARRSGRILVWRGKDLIHHASMDDEDARCLELLRQGEPLGRICQQIAAGRSLEKATLRVGRLLQTWIDDGLLADVRLPPLA